MLLGGPVFAGGKDPHLWLAALARAGYRTGIPPLDGTEDEATVRSFAAAAEAAGVVLAEVGAWSNPLSPDEAERRAALALCRARLDLADRLGARCCVNIAGSRGCKWDGPDPANLSEETFDLIVETVRAIIDEVRPVRTFYTLEPMPWVHPSSPDDYLRLIRAIDRPAFAVHLDPVNMINCPWRYYTNGAFLRECFAKLGPYIKSCHAKDIILRETLTVHLEEVRPGLGGLDYRVFLGELAKLPPDTPLLLEHLPDEASYAAAAAHLRRVAVEMGVALS